MYYMEKIKISQFKIQDVGSITFISLQDDKLFRVTCAPFYVSPGS